MKLLIYNIVHWKPFDSLNLFIIQKLGISLPGLMAFTYLGAIFSETWNT